MLVDSSVWIDLLRRSQTPALARFRTLSSDEVVTSDPVMLEVLSGARDDQHAEQLRSMVGQGRWVRTIIPDYQRAARIHRRCRDAGTPVARGFDSLIAAVAIRADVELLTSDRGFAAIAACTPLRLAAT
jgi:predicted nucleic acid-binding protein